MPASLAQPGYTHTLPNLPSAGGGAEGVDDSDDFVSWNYGVVDMR